MSFFFGDATSSPLDTFAGGEASLSSIADASWTAMRYAHNTNARKAAVEEAYDRRIEAVHAATGVMLENPLRADTDPQPREQRPVGAAGRRSDRDRYARARDAFHERLGALAGQFPDARPAIRPELTIESEAIAIGRGAADAADAASDSRDGLGKWSAMLAGSAIGAFEDPATWAGMAVPVGGAGTVATVAGRILSVSARSALATAATEGAMQPAVQGWYRDLGLPNGFGEALKNMGFAAALGGILGGGAAGVGEILRQATRRAGAAPEIVTRALEGDAQAGARLLEPIRGSLPAETRGAIDAARRLREQDAARPAGVSAEAHRLAMGRSILIAADPEADIVRMPVDEAQVQRIVQRLAPEPTEAQSDIALPAFLMRMGGLRDDKGDVAAIAGGQMSERFVGKLISDRGLPLDRARELAAEAGYLDHLYGSPEEAMARSTPADLLNTLDDALRGRSISRSAEAEEASVETLAADVAAHIGIGAPDDMIVRAMRFVQDEDLTPFQAAERVLVEEVQTMMGTTGPVRVMADTGEGVPSIPGWSDEELEAAMRPRGLEPEANGLDNPASFADDLLLTPDDLDGLDAFPLIDAEGRVVELARFLDDLDAEDWSARVVEACRA